MKLPEILHDASYCISLAISLIDLPSLYNRIAYSSFPSLLISNSQAKTFHEAICPDFLDALSKVFCITSALAVPMEKELHFRLVCHFSYKCLNDGMVEMKWDTSVGMNSGKRE
jgi:hypothetical protein